ncbi:MAG TPA: hypothetical protein VGB66_18230 [Longimicrobium sp.]|jgi:hypothetical protein
MMVTSEAGARPSPMRLLEMLSDRSGLFEALAYSTIKLNRCTSADELSMDAPPDACAGTTGRVGGSRLAPETGAGGPAPLRAEWGLR